MEKLGALYTADGNVTWSTTMENRMEVPQKLKIELPYDPAVPFLGVYTDGNQDLLER